MLLHLSRPVLPAAALLLGLASLAGAQQPAPDATVPEVPAPAQPDSNRGSDPCAGQPGASGGDQTLTGQLSRCDGVLTPPPTGDDAQAPVPDPNPDTTPVVPPGAVPDQAPNGTPTSPPDGGSDPSPNGG